MESKQIHFKQAYKKQLWLAILSLIYVVLFPFVTGLKTDFILYVWFGTSTLILISIPLLLKKVSKEARCPHCKTDLFETIEAAKASKIKFNFCPTCGNEVKI